MPTLGQILETDFGLIFELILRLRAKGYKFSTQFEKIFETINFNNQKTIDSAAEKLVKLIRGQDNESISKRNTLITDLAKIIRKFRFNLKRNGYFKVFSRIFLTVN